MPQRAAMRMSPRIFGNLVLAQKRARRARAPRLAMQPADYEAVRILRQHREAHHVLSDLENGRGHGIETWIGAWH